MSLKKILMLSLILFYITKNVQAQNVFAFNIGWNISKFFKPLSNLETPMADFNQLNPNIEKKYEMPGFFQGIYFDIRSGSPKSGIIFSWNNKHGIAKAEGIATGSGETEYKIRNIKTRLNALGIGAYFSLYRRLKMGITFDLGTFTIVKKIATPDQIKVEDWIPFYDKKSVGAYGFTANISYPLSFSKSIQLRFQPYLQIIKLMQYPTFSSKKYFYNPSTFGITAFLSFISDH